MGNFSFNSHALETRKGPVGLIRVNPALIGKKCLTLKKSICYSSAKVTFGKGRPPQETPAGWAKPRKIRLTTRLHKQYVFAILTGVKPPGTSGPILTITNGGRLLFSVDRKSYRLVTAHSWKGRSRWRIGGLLLMKFAFIWASAMKPFTNGSIKWGFPRTRLAVDGCSSVNRSIIGCNPVTPQSKKKIDTGRHCWEENYPLIVKFISYNDDVHSAEAQRHTVSNLYKMFKSP